METKNRNEHLQWCKDRAIQYVERGDIQGAYGSFASDMRKHPETKDHPALGMGIMLLATGNLSTPNAMRKFIEDFN